MSISGFTCPNIDGTVANGGCSFVKMILLVQIYKKKNKFKLNPRINNNPYLENQLKQLELQF